MSSQSHISHLRNPIKLKLKSFQSQDSTAHLRLACQPQSAYTCDEIWGKMSRMISHRKVGDGENDEFRINHFHCDWSFYITRSCASSYDDDEHFECESLMELNHSSGSRTHNIKIHIIHFPVWKSSVFLHVNFLIHTTHAPLPLHRYIYFWHSLNSVKFHIFHLLSGTSSISMLFRFHFGSSCEGFSLYSRCQPTTNISDRGRT